jgi:hypothetical protein
MPGVPPTLPADVVDAVAALLEDVDAPDVDVPDVDAPDVGRHCE